LETHGPQYFDDRAQSTWRGQTRERERPPESICQGSSFHHALSLTPLPNVLITAPPPLLPSSQIGEEFLLLLPECLPFLSELLEDDNSEVTEVTAALVRYIEELSGESLDQWLV